MNSLFNLRPLYCCHYHHHQPQHKHAAALHQTLVVIRRALSTSQLKKYYSLLNCTRESSIKEIKESFLRLSKIYHPDNKETGSHQKFVQLKEAYDAVKDGPPAVRDGSHYHRTAHPSNPTNGQGNSYSNYTDWSDLRQHGRRQNPYEDPFSSRRTGFGGPYGRSSTPWEDLMRERTYERRRREEGDFGLRRSGTLNGTLLLSALAWIVIYSCVILGWDSNFGSERMTNEEFRRRSYADFEAFEERKRRRAFYVEMDRRRRAMEEDKVRRSNANKESNQGDKLDDADDSTIVLGSVR